ncbi:MAG: hypothetical protein AAFW46_01470 [Pseudomonadota bacterium]
MTLQLAGLGGDRRSEKQSPEWVKKLKAASGRQLETALEQPYLMALMIGSLLLSFASFFTTYAGMLNFMPVWVISFCITFAVQALLFVTSWRIGFALADKEGAPWFSIFVFAICLATSVFFSWVALFESINDEDLQARTRDTRMHRAVEDTVSELQTRAIERRREQVESLLDSDVFASWRDSVTQVADRATGARDILEDSLRERAREIASKIDALQQQKDVILRRQATAEEQLATSGRDLERLESSRPQMLERVNRLRGELDVAEEAVVLKEGEMQAEETGGGEDRAAGRGPVWRELRDERNILAAQRDTKRRLFEAAQIELSEMDTLIRDLKAATASGGAAGVAAQVEAIDNDIQQLRAAISGGDDGEGVNLEAEVTQLRANLSAFATRFDLAPFDAAAAKCSELLEAMQKNPALSSQVAGVSCDTALMAEFMNPIGQAEADLRALEAACVPGGEGAQVVTALSFQEATKYGRECIGLSGLPAGEVSDLRSEIDRLVLEEDPNASRFVKTVNAFQGGEKLSYFALAIAGAIDFLVLFSGLIGAVSTRPKIAQHVYRQSDRQKEENVLRALTVNLDPDPSDTKSVEVAKIVLRSVKPIAALPKQALERDYGFEARVVMEDLAEPAAEADVRQLLVSLCGSDMAFSFTEYDEEEDYEYEVFAIRTGFLDVLREVIEDHERKMEDEDPTFRQRRRAATRRLTTGGVAALPAPGFSGAAATGRSPLPGYDESVQGRVTRVGRDEADGLRRKQRAQQAQGRSGGRSGGRTPPGARNENVVALRSDDAPSVGGSKRDLRAIEDEREMTSETREEFLSGFFNNIMTGGAAPRSERDEDAEVHPRDRGAAS